MRLKRRAYGRGGRRSPGAVIRAGHERKDDVLYRQNEALTDYLLVSQNAACIDHYVRHTDGQWLLTTAEGLDASLYIASLGCTRLLSEVYNKIEFAAGETAIGQTPSS